MGAQTRVSIVTTEGVRSPVYIGIGAAANRGLLSLSAEIRTLQLRSRQIDHRLGQGAIKALGDFVWVQLCGTEATLIAALYGGPWAQFMFKLSVSCEMHAL